MGNPMPIVGVIIAKTGEKLNFVQASDKGILKPGLARSLLEAQAANGCITDPITAKTYPITG